MLFVLLLVSFQSFTVQQEELPSWKVRVAPHIGFSATYTCNNNANSVFKNELTYTFPPFKEISSDGKSRVMLNFRLKMKGETVGILSGKISLSPDLWNRYQPIIFFVGTDPAAFFKASEDLGAPMSLLRLSLTFNGLDEVFSLDVKNKEGELTPFSIKILKDAGSENKKIKIE